MATLVVLIVYAIGFGCTSFGTLENEPDAGTDGAVAPVPLRDAAVAVDAPSGADVITASPCPVPRVVDSSVGTRCPGDSRERFLATDDQNCGRCGESCGGEGCERGYCKERVDNPAVQRLLGGSDDAVLIAVAVAQDTSDIIAVRSGGPQKLGTVPGVPRTAVLLGGDAFVRTQNKLHRVGASPAIEKMIDGDRPFVTVVGGRVVTTGRNEVVSYDRDLGDKQTRGASDLFDVVGAGDALVALIAPSGRGGSPSSLRTAQGESSLVSLVSDVGDSRNIAARGIYAYYGNETELYRARLAGGAPEKVASFPGVVDAYLETSAIAAGNDAVRVVVARSGSVYALYELDLCAGAAPTLATTATNLAGVHATNDRVYWVTDTATLRSRRIARRP